MAKLNEAAEWGPDEERKHSSAWVVERPKLNGPVLPADYDPGWPALYEREAARIRSLLGDRVLLLEHIGSTSVPGLAAKPIVDILLVVPDPADESSYVAVLAEAGYQLVIREPDWHQHRVLKGPDTNINLHVHAEDSQEIGRNLRFRDHLRRRGGPRAVRADQARTGRKELDLPPAVRRRQVGRGRGDPPAQLAGPGGRAGEAGGGLAGTDGERGRHVRWTGPDGYWASDERDLVDVALVHAWLSREAYWALGRPFEVVARSIENSLVVGLYAADGAQAGFARFVTDYATFGWLCDVFVDPAHQGRGLGSFLAGTAIAHPAVAAVHQVLATAPGRTLYARQGYAPLASPERWMERR
jgi:GrpB-like predicted nucleotidyltransferase (UPF0157 family)/GNAT superfamily N-acetyltransferase